MVENKIAEIKDGADLATWKDEAEEGRPYAAAIVGGYTYVRVKSRELAEEIAAELESAAELGCDPYVDDELLEAELTKAERLAEYKQRALELEQEKVDELEQIAKRLECLDNLLGQITRTVDALNRLTEAVRELAPV